MQIILAGDHYTVELMALIEQLLLDQAIDYENVGAKMADSNLSLPEIILKVTEKVVHKSGALGILACGTGVGVEIGANRRRGIRASLCRDAEQAKNARIYDNANVLCLGSWYNDDFEAIVASFLSHQFDNNEKRRQMLQDFDNLDKRSPS